MQNQSSLKDDLVLNAIFNPHTPFESIELSDESIDDTDNYNVSGVMKALEIDAVNAAQKGELEESLSLFNDLIENCPSYPSAYNNRAQLYRIQGKNDLALLDLNKAIEFSGGRGKAASQAYVQRGVIAKMNEENDLALANFKLAACLGNKFARSQVTAMNPYAALCNQMLSEVFQRIYEGKQDI